VAEGAPWIELHLKISLGTLALEADLVSKRHAVAVVGPSGSGKSTLLRVLAGVERGATGRVRVRGEVWQDSTSGVFRPPWARGVGWVPQDALLFPHLNVSENLAYSGAPRTRVQEMARLLSVDALLDRRPRRLSGGEQQRVALGRALLSEPGLLLLDEPFSALDRPLRAQVAERVRTFCSEREVPVLLVSHDERDAQALAEEQWLVEDGRLQRL
jgi:molybdate transport system ATP-binding protein